MGVNGLFGTFLTLSLFLTTSIALRCFLCGQYNDGVGSITPCINETHSQLKDCPLKEHSYCIKYVSEGSVVKDCVAECIEKELWSTRTYCCNQDGCNSAMGMQGGLLIVCGALILQQIIMH